MRDERPCVREGALAPAVEGERSLDAGARESQSGLPVLSGPGVTLREPQVSDARALLTMLTTEDVARFVWPLPRSVAGLEEFLARCPRERASGRAAWFGVVPEGLHQAVGLFELRKLEPGFTAAGWHFAIGVPYRVTGLFVAAARLVCAFAFEMIRVHRLEARTAVRNGRGNGALRKTGAVPEGTPQTAFSYDGEFVDQIRWSILDENWRRATDAGIPFVH